MVHIAGWLLILTDLGICAGGFLMGFSYYVREKERQRKEK